jgi:hypothetical protein
MIKQPTGLEWNEKNLETFMGRQRLKFFAPELQRIK